MIQEYYPRPAGIARVATELYARKIIDKTTHDAVLNEECRLNARADILLTALKTRLTEDPRCAGEIKEVLERTGNCSLMKALENKWQQLSPQLSVDVGHPKGLTVTEKILALRRSFSDLLDAFRDEISNVHAGTVKEVVTQHLKSLLPELQSYYMKQLEHKHNVEDVLQFLISSGFCSYLDYKLLSAIISHCGNEKLIQHLESYGKEYKAFCKENTLSEVVHTLTANEELQPKASAVVSVGTPSLVFQLSHPWPDLRLHTAITTLCCVLPWVSQLQLQAVQGGDHIALVFCVNKSALTSLVRDLQKPETARSLQDQGIFVMLQMATHLIAQPAVVMTTDYAVKASDKTESVVVFQQKQEEEKKEKQEEENRHESVSSEPQVQTTTRTSGALEERLEEYEREVEMLLQKRAARLTVEQPRVEDTELKEQFTSLMDYISENWEEIQATIRSIERQSQIAPAHVAAQGTKDQLIVQLCNDVTSLNFQLEDMRDEYRALLKGKEEVIKLLQAQLEESTRILTNARDQHVRQLEVVKEKTEAVLNAKQEIKLLRQQLEEYKRVHPTAHNQRFTVCQLDSMTKPHTVSLTTEPPPRRFVHIEQETHYHSSYTLSGIYGGHGQLVVGLTDNAL